MKTTKPKAPVPPKTDAGVRKGRYDDPRLEGMRLCDDIRKLIGERKVTINTWRGLAYHFALWGRQCKRVADRLTLNAN